MLNLTSNGHKQGQIKPKKQTSSLPENILYNLLDYVQAGWSYQDIVKANLCPKEHRPVLKSFINRYRYAN